MEINLSVVLMAMVNFFVLLFIVKKFLYTPILNVLDERARVVSDTLSSADETKKEAEALKASYELTLKDAHKEAKEILASANKMGENEKERILKEAQEEVKLLNERAKAELEREKIDAFLSLKNEVADLALGASEMILSREVKREDHQSAIDAYLSKRVGG